MARIRTIKPEFPQSESMGRVSRDARLLFIQLWTLCDDEGRARAASRMLASLLFPYDDDAPNAIDGWLVELERENCIVRYEAGGNTYLQISKWLEHQKIDKPSRSKIPEFSEASRIFSKPRECSSEDLRTKDQGSKDQGGDQEGSGEDASPRNGAQPPLKANGKVDQARGSRLSESWEPSADDLSYAASHGFEGQDVARQLEKFKTYWLSSAGQKSRKANWSLTWKNWILNSEDRGRPRIAPVELDDDFWKGVEERTKNGH